MMETESTLGKCCCVQCTVHGPWRPEPEHKKNITKEALNKIPALNVVLKYHLTFVQNKKNKKKKTVSEMEEKLIIQKPSRKLQLKRVQLRTKRS